MARNFTVTIQVEKADGGERIFFKPDGQRFDLEQTLKLNTDTKYSMDISAQPPCNIQNVNVHGTSVTLAEKERDDNKVTFTTEWFASGFELDKGGKRHLVPISFDLGDHGNVTGNLQVKFYASEEDRHSRWGTPLSFMEFQCSVPETGTGVELMKTTFR